MKWTELKWIAFCIFLSERLSQLIDPNNNIMSVIYTMNCIVIVEINAFINDEVVGLGLDNQMQDIYLECIQL